MHCASQPLVSFYFCLIFSLTVSVHRYIGYHQPNHQTVASQCSVMSRLRVQHLKNTILQPPTHLEQPRDRSLITRKVGQSVGRLVVLGLCRFSRCRCRCCSHTLGLQLCQAQLFTCLQTFIPTLHMPMSLQDQVREFYCRCDRFYRIWTSVYLYLVALHCRQVSPCAIFMILRSYDTFLTFSFHSMLSFLVFFCFRRLPLFCFLLLVQIAFRINQIVFSYKYCLQLALKKGERFPLIPSVYI